MTDNETQNPVEQIGGVDQLKRIIESFYERIFDDPMIGFMFEEIDREKLIDKQVEYIHSNLGNGEYTGRPIRQAHREQPILPGHFDRRHEILKETLLEFDIPDQAREIWLEFEQSLRPLIVQTGEQHRSDILNSE